MKNTQNNLIMFDMARFHIHGAPRSLCIYSLHGIVPWAALKFWTGNILPIVVTWSDVIGTGAVFPSLLGDTNPCRDGWMIFLAIPCSPPIAASSLDILPLAESKITKNKKL